MLRRLLALGVVGSMAALGGSALAHHAGTMYDHARVETVSGAVKEWRWANPHAFLQILAPDASGQEVVWSFESTSPNILVRSGWRRTTFKPGDKVKVMYNPLKDGAPGGSLTGVVLPDGTELKAQAGSGGANSATGSSTSE
jgi:hypothetical protein